MKRRARRREALAAAERALEHSTAKLDHLRGAYDRSLAEGGVVLFQQVDTGVDAFHVSASMTDVLGWDARAFTGIGILRAMVHPDDLDAFDAALGLTGGPGVESAVIDLTGDPVAETAADPAAAIRTEATGAVPVVRFRTASGPWARVQVRPADTTDEKLGPARGVLVDVTATQHDQVRALRFAEMVERCPGAHLVLEFTDPDDPTSLVIRAANAAAHEMFRLESEDLDGTPIEAVLGAASAQLIRSALFDVSHTGEPITAERLSLVEVPGTYLDLRIDRLGDGTISLAIADVTATAALEERLRHQASHDALTGLPNRALFEERLGGALANATADAPLALVLVDIDGFRELNDHLGVHLADRLLVEMGRRLVREVRGCALVSRFGGDEFALMTLPCASEAEAIERARAARGALDRAFDLDGHLVEVAASVGVAVSSPDAAESKVLVRSAFRALTEAKAHELRFAVAARDASAGSIHRLALLSELRQGLANRDLELRYQPVIDLRTGHVTKVEAVLRWRQDSGSDGLPVEFLELAEHSGLIQPLTRWILGEAAGASAHLATTDRPVTVSTDLSIRNLFDPELIGFLALLISSGELDPTAVELEISETELMDDPVRAHEVLRRLDELGLRLVVDDFGTGYTSLSTMQHLPIAGLKIDRSFVSTIGATPADASIVRSTIELCHELGLSVGADGVADDHTLSVLADFGCDQAQGLHLSGPVTLDELPERIEQLELAVRGWVGSARSS